MTTHDRTGNPAASLPITFDQHPDTFEERYQLTLLGDCMTPTIADGEVVLCLKSEPYEAGDLVVVYKKPEFLKPGEHQAIIKRLLLAPMPGYDFTGPAWRGDAAPIVLLVAENSPEPIAIRLDHILAIHKCAGPMRLRQPVADRTAADTPPIVDPLIEAIRIYRSGIAAFNASTEEEWEPLGGEDARIAGTYGVPLDILERWDQPAISREGAVEALRFAHEENQWYACNPTVVAMVAAALAYFEQEAAR